MTGRSIPDEANKYRYGFNGKENDDDDEWGQSLVQDYGFRLYNPTIGKFLSVDPLAKDYPYYTPYQFAGNMPIKFIDLDGLEPTESPTAMKLINTFSHGTMLQAKTGEYVWRSIDENAQIHYQYWNEKNNWEVFTPRYNCLSCEVTALVLHAPKTLAKNIYLTHITTLKVGTGEADVNRILGVNIAGTGVEKSGGLVVFTSKYNSPLFDPLDKTNYVVDLTPKAEGTFKQTKGTVTSTLKLVADPNSFTMHGKVENAPLGVNFKMKLDKNNNNDIFDAGLSLNVYDFSRDFSVNSKLFSTLSNDAQKQVLQYLKKESKVILSSSINVNMPSINKLIDDLMGPVEISSLKINK